MSPALNQQALMAGRLKQGKYSASVGRSFRSST
jgi:hypothetical protein